MMEKIRNQKNDIVLSIMHKTCTCNIDKKTCLKCTNSTLTIIEVKK